MKQEQEPAADEIEEVAPSILRLQLPVHLPGLGHVNTYAIEDGRGFALVDPGLPGQASWEALCGRLDSAGIPLRRVHTVIITHSHPDHFGGAAPLVRESGAQVWASEHFRSWCNPQELGEAELEARVTDPSIPLDELPGWPFGRPTPWGGLTEDIPEDRKVLMDQHRGEMLKWFRVPSPTLGVIDSQPVMLGGREWLGLFTPGHTDDHLCLFDPTEGILIAGDHVLPSITPHISGLIEGDPIARYVESLDRVASLEGVTTVLPAHGHPFDDIAGRVDEIKEHHDLRLDRIREISTELGDATVEQISKELFAPRSWGSMAESETFAHLEHLRLAGKAHRGERAGTMTYLVD